MSGHRRRRRRVVALSRERERERQRLRRISWSRDRAPFRSLVSPFPFPLSLFFVRCSLASAIDPTRDREIDRDRASCHAHSRRGGHQRLARRKCVATSWLLLDGSSSGNGTAAALRHRSAYAAREQVRVRWHRQSVFECKCVDRVRRAVPRERKINNKMWMKRMKSVCSRNSVQCLMNSLNNIK